MGHSRSEFVLFRSLFTILLLFRFHAHAFELVETQETRAIHIHAKKAPRNVESCLEVLSAYLLQLKTPLKG